MNVSNTRQDFFGELFFHGINNIFKISVSSSINANFYEDEWTSLDQNNNFTKIDDYTLRCNIPG